MAATVLPSMVGTTLCFPSQNPNHGSRNKKNCRLSSSTYFNPSIALYQHRLSAFGPSPFLSFCASRGHDRIRARRSRIHIFLPHLVASLQEVEETYVMVKPDGVQRGLVGDIISRFEKKGFLLKGLKLFQCPKELAEEHYKELKDKSFYPKLINYITSGPVVCMAWEGIGVVASARKLIGTTNPLQAEPGTIRGDLAVQTGRNVVHGSDSPDNGHREVVMARKKSVTPMAQQRKIVIDDFSNGHANVVDEIEAVPEDEGLPLLESRCYLANFAKRIENWQINDREWALLRRTPFGRLIKDILDLEMNIEIVDALLGFWDEEHCGFLVGGIIIPFTVDDIALITGLPNRGRKVVRQRIGFKHDGEFSRIYLTITIIERRLDDIIRNRNDPNPEADKRFVQQMILYLWGSVLFPSSCRTVPTYMACHVKNLDSIGSYNWAEALHSFLVKEINAKSKVVKERNEGKEVVAGYMNGLCFIINAWIFEHVDFGEDSRPSNPEVRPRMLKWAKKGCKFWQRKPFLQRFRDIVVDKVCYRLLPKNDEFELISLHSVEHMPSHIGGCDDAVRGNFSLVGNLEAGGPDIRAGCQETEQRGREDKKEKQVPKVEKDHSSDIANLTQVVFKQLARISVLERKIVNLETLVASNGKREIEGMNDTINGKFCEQVGYGLTKSGDKGHTVEVIGHPKLGSITRSEKQEGRQLGKRKMLKSTIAKEHHMLKRRDIPADKASSPSMESSTGFERKDADILVNLDDYAGPTEHKKAAIVAPLNYVGRELLTENVRQYLDAFCMKPMQRDDIVFFDWNICIRRLSMVEYLQGGYTSEEIIDAYALILYEGVTMSGDNGDNSASFLYVPPMFLGLYRNKLGSYKTFLNAVDKKSLEKVKLLILPCHISTANHWLLIVCDMKMKKWIGYDSLYDPRHREAAKEQIMLLTEYLHQDHGLDIRSWSLEYRRIYPQQEPSTLDCGVFVMKFIESIVRVPMVINFRGTDMRLFRPQIAYKILQHC